MSRKSKRDIERAIQGLQANAVHADAVPMVVPKNALSDGEAPDLEVSTDGLRESVDGEEINLRLPYHRPRGLFGAGIPLITEDEVACWWDALPDEVRTAERELREERDDPIPAVLRGEA